MQSVWVFAGFGMLAAIAVRFWWAIERGRDENRGFVSQQWLAEHRHSQSHAERR